MAIFSMKPKGLLTHSEEPFTGPYPKPVESSPHPHTKWSLPSRFSDWNSVRISPPCMLHVPSVLSSLILLPIIFGEQYRLGSSLCNFSNINLWFWNGFEKEWA
jgi:hypothetical protein